MQDFGTHNKGNQIFGGSEYFSFAWTQKIRNIFRPKTRKNGFHVDYPILMSHFLRLPGIWEWYFRTLRSNLTVIKFGSEKMVIGRFGESNEDVRNVQGPKSKNLHFDAKVCRTCNSERTQAADREFDRFRREARIGGGAVGRRQA